MSALRYRHIFQNQHCTAQCCIKCASVLWVPPEADLNGKEEFIQFEGPGPLLEEGMVKMVIVFSWNLMVFVVCQSLNSEIIDIFLYFKHFL